MHLEEHPLLQGHSYNIPDSILNEDPPMLAVIAKLTAMAGRAQELKQILAVACSLVRPNEPGVPQYHATLSREDPHIFKMFEVYRDRAALEHHQPGTAYIGALLPAIMDELARHCRSEHSTQRRDRVRGMALRPYGYVQGAWNHGEPEVFRGSW